VALAFGFWPVEVNFKDDADEALDETVVPGGADEAGEEYPL